MTIGTGKRKRKTEYLTWVSCPFCNANNSLVAEGYQEFLIFGLPMFPLGKKVEVKCCSCNRIFEEQHLPYPVDSRVSNMRSQIKPAFWMYAFPLIVAVLLPIALIKQSATSKKNIAKIEHAHKGDVYTFKTGEMLYQKMKIEKIFGDSIWFYKSLNDPERYSDLGSNDVFLGDEIIFTKQELLKKNSDYDIDEISQSAGF